MMAHLNPQSQSRLNAKKTSDEKLRLMGKSAGKLDLNEYEGEWRAGRRGNGRTRDNGRC